MATTIFEFSILPAFLPREMPKASGADFTGDSMSASCFITAFQYPSIPAFQYFGLSQYFDFTSKKKNP